VIRERLTRVALSLAPMIREEPMIPMIRKSVPIFTPEHEAQLAILLANSSVITERNHLGTLFCPN